MRIYGVTITTLGQGPRPAVQCTCSCGLRVRRRTKRAGQTWQLRHMREHRQA